MLSLLEELVARGAQKRKKLPPDETGKKVDDHAAYRFLTSINHGTEDQCWEWNAGRSETNYGKFSFRNKTMIAQRFSFLFFNGFLPDDLCVLHKCDNPPCVNPNHLFLGTMLDNVRDRDAKGRQAKGDRAGLRLHPERIARGLRNGHYTKPESTPRGDAHHWHTKPETHPRGEKVNTAILISSQVLEIRRAHAAKEENIKELASRFGVKDKVVRRVLHRETWAHL